MNGLLAAVVLGASAIGTTGQTVASLAALHPRSTYICIIPDTQNQTDPEQETSSTISPDMTACNLGTLCVPGIGTCTDSPYCSRSWINSGQRVLQNQTRDLLGRWGEVDWEGMQGNGRPFTVATKPNHMGPHPRCDLILHVGDMIDEGDFSTGASSGAAFTQWQRFRGSMMDELFASGIPFLAALGNHDDAVYFANDFIPRLRTKSYYHTDGSAVVDYLGLGVNKTLYVASILAPTPAGKICVVTGPFYGGVGSGSGTSGVQALYDLAKAQIGCGASYPTILLSHNGAGSAFTKPLEPTNLITNEVTSEEVFMWAYGHFTFAFPANTMNLITGTTGVQFHDVFCNFQELDRLTGTGFGLSPSDGAAGTYCVIKLSPTNDTITEVTWTPYFQNSIANNPGYSVEYKVLSFDFDARFP